MTAHKKDAVSVHDLIEERGQIGQWLEKLAAATDKPENVRAKVRAGYEKRLAEIAAALQGARKEIEETLKRHKAALAELQVQEQAAAEKLAEAEVRHSVGELSESAWKKLHHELAGVVEKVGEKVKAAADAAERTGAALASLDPNATVAATKGVASADAKPVPTGPQLESKMSEFVADPDPVVPTLSGKLKAHPKAAAPAPTPGEAAAAATIDPNVSMPPTPASATPPPAAKKPSGGFDELAFIKSVSEDDKQGPSAHRASGMARLSSSEPIIPDQKVIDAGGDAAPPAAPPPRPPKPAASAPKAKATPAGDAAQGAKSVKCKECGTMNLPTEWYCSSCGAELSQI